MGGRGEGGRDRSFTRFHLKQRREIVLIDSKNLRRRKHPTRTSRGGRRDFRHAPPTRISLFLEGGGDAFVRNIQTRSRSRLSIVFMEMDYHQWASWIKRKKKQKNKKTTTPRTGLNVGITSIPATYVHHQGGRWISAHSEWTLHEEGGRRWEKAITPICLYNAKPDAGRFVE